MSFVFLRIFSKVIFNLNWLFIFSETSWPLHFSHMLTIHDLGHGTWAFSLLFQEHALNCSIVIYCTVHLSKNSVTHFKLTLYTLQIWNCTQIVHSGRVCQCAVQMWNLQSSFVLTDCLLGQIVYIEEYCDQCEVSQWFWRKIPKIPGHNNSCHCHPC